MVSYPWPLFLVMLNESKVQTLKFEILCQQLIWIMCSDLVEFSCHVLNDKGILDIFISAGTCSFHHSILLFSALQFYDLA